MMAERKILKKENDVMRQTRCEKGHFYDADRYASCPHCANMAGGMPQGNPTVTKTLDDQVTVTLGKPEQAAQMEQVVQMAPKSEGVAAEIREVVPFDDEPVTQGFFKKDSDPVVGWLVCTKGVHKGEDFRLRAGRNFIGRGQDMDIKLTGENTVSRDKHAIVLYEPNQRIFLAQMGESHELVYLNGELLLSNAQMKAYDRIQLGDAELMLVPCCGENFDWQEKK